MIALIPFAMVLFLVAIMISIQQVGEAELRETEYRNIASGIAYHHNLVVSRRDTLTGKIDMIEMNSISPIEGLTSFIQTEGPSIYIVTWPSRFYTGTQVTASHHDIDVLNRSMERAVINFRTFNQPGNTTKKTTIEDENLPFLLPADPQSPALVTVITSG